MRTRVARPPYQVECSCQTTKALSLPRAPYTLVVVQTLQNTLCRQKQFGKKMVSSVLPGLATDCEGHGEKHSQGSQLNASLHTAMNAHIASLKMLALPPEQLQAQLPPAQPPRS